MTTIAQALWADNSNMTQKLQWRQMESLITTSFGAV